MLVCHCKVVTDRDIRAAIAAGARDECEIAAVCGAGSGCGGCLGTVQQLLGECIGCPFSDAALPTSTNRPYSDVR